MPDLVERFTTLFQQARSGHIPPPLVADLPPGACLPAGVAGQDIRRGQDYFTVYVHELSLAQNQQWWSLYDPLVVTVTELVHDGRRVAIPAVVGPESIRRLQPDAAIPTGLVLRDTPVAGPFPYRGGSVAITVMLYRVKVGDHARRLLGLLDGLSNAIGIKEAQVAMRIGSALVDGLEAVLGLEDTVPVAGQRTVQDGDSFRGFRTGFSALIAPPGADSARLRVVDGGRLHLATESGSRPFSGADYVLCGIQARPRRGEIDTLPAAPLLNTANTAAAAGDEEGWRRAKAGLLTAYQQMIGSPDLTHDDADAILAEWRDRIVKTRTLAQSTAALSRGGGGAPESREEKKLSKMTAELLDMDG